MDIDGNESQLQEYQIQLEQVEIALKTDPTNAELLKLKEDLVEIINLTKELIEEDSGKSDKTKITSGQSWKQGDKCMAIWRVDGKYYSATVDQVLEDGTCTVIFDGYSNTEITQVSQLMQRNKNSNTLNNKDYLTQTKSSASSQVGHKKAFTKKELEQKLKEAKKRKKEKFALKLKAMDEMHEKEKNKWKSFNTKLASKTWKGVVSKNKFETPVDHENKIGVGTNSSSNRVVSANGTILTNTSATASAASLSSASKSKLPKF